MKISVVLDNGLDPENSVALGGEYATCDVSVIVDSTLPLRTQRILVIHAILENYNPSWVHDKIDELTALIEDGLDQLKEE